MNLALLTCQWLCKALCITDILNTRHYKVHDKELDLIAREDDQEIKHKAR
jgi:hypothetical protein